MSIIYVMHEIKIFNKNIVIINLMFFKRQKHFYYLKCVLDGMLEYYYVYIHEFLMSFYCRAFKAWV